MSDRSRLSIKFGRVFEGEATGTLAVTALVVVAMSWVAIYWLR
jgi:hypothetical protein